MKLKFVLISVLVVLFFWIFWRGINVFQSNLEDIFYAQISQPLEGLYLVKVPKKPKKPNLEIEAKSTLSVMITETGKKKTFFGQSINQALPIASLTKLMTAIIVLENPENYNLSETVTVSRRAISQPEDFGSLKVEDKLPVQDLLHLLLIESSNDAAYALAEAIGVEPFVEKMNQKANALGLTDTHFINPTGLEPEDPENSINHSSSQDLVALSEYILNHHPLIFEISSKMYYEVSDSSGQFHHLAINKNGFLQEFPNLIGQKTGFTNKAGGCIIVVLKNKNSHLVNVILGTKTPEDRPKEMKKLIDWGNY